MHYEKFSSSIEMKTLNKRSQTTAYAGLSVLPGLTHVRPNSSMRFPQSLQAILTFSIFDLSYAYCTDHTFLFCFNIYCFIKGRSCLMVSCINLTLSTDYTLPQSRNQHYLSYIQYRVH